VCERLNTMGAILQALAKSAGLLFPAIIVAILASIASVRRAEALARLGGQEADSESSHGGEAQMITSPKQTFMPDRDPTVLEILILGAVLFTITMGLLLGYSVFSQM